MFGQEVHLALRLLGKSRGATALSILSIALGIGLTTGIFSVEDAMLLRPFAIDKPAGLHYVSSRADDGRWILYGWPDYEDMVQAGSDLGEFAAYQRRGLRLMRQDEMELVLASPVTPNYFSLLGVRAELGRASLNEVDGRPAAVISHSLWMRVYGGDPQIVGKTMVFNGSAFAVAGVMPSSFNGLARGVVNDVWVGTEAWFGTLQNWRERQNRGGQFEIVARLKPGVTAGMAAARLDAAIRGPGKRKPAPAGANATLLTAQFAPDWRKSTVIGGGTLLVLGLILFVACANVAQLRLAQSEARRKEFAVRMAMGSGTWRAVRQLLLESSLVGIAGGVLGIFLAHGLLIKAAQFISGGQKFIDFGLRLDVRVLAYSVAATLFAVLLTGLAPIRHALRLNVAAILKSEQGATGSHVGWHRQILIVGQLAVSIVLFGMSVLSVQSLRQALAVRPGLDPQKKLFILDLSPGSRGSNANWADELCRRLSGLPGVRGATFVRRMPLSGSGGGATVRVEIPGLAPMGLHYNNVGGSYFAVMGTRIIAGRPLDDNDRQGSAPVVVASQTFASQVFGARNAVGEWIPVNGKQRQIVGIAEDGPSNDLHQPGEPFLYIPYAQMPSDDLAIAVETAVDPASLAQTFRREVKQYDPRAIIYSTTTLREHMSRALTQDWMMVVLAIGLGAFGVLLTAAGLFGVLQYNVSRRTRELGLRIALGASGRGIQQLVLRDSLWMAALGMPLGLGLLAVAAKYLGSLVPMASKFDPLAFVLSAVATVAVALAAGWLPARRATRVDPAVALRSE
jgi:putative ABC transport system permease protein